MRNSEVLGNSVDQTMAIETLSDAVNYRRWLATMALPLLGGNPIELGSGIGDYAAEWLAAGVRHVTATEADSSRLAVLRSRFESDSR